MVLEPGDIAACYGVDLTSRAISFSTLSPFGTARLRWPPSHVALMGVLEERIVWFESTTMCSRPCMIRGQRTAGAQVHLPEARIADYTTVGGCVDVYRLTGINRLSQEESLLLSWLLVEHFIRPGIAYDVGGALLSGTRVFQCLRLFPGANLETLFCSELIAALLMRLGRMNHSNPTRFNPGRLLRALVHSGKYFHQRRISSAVREERSCG